MPFRLLLILVIFNFNFILLTIVIVEICKGGFKSASGISDQDVLVLILGAVRMTLAGENAR